MSISVAFVGEVTTDRYVVAWQLDHCLINTAASLLTTFPFGAQRAWAFIIRNFQHSYPLHQIANHEQEKCHSI